MIKLMIGLLIIACIALLLIKGPSGEPLMTLEDRKIALPIELKGLVGNPNDGVKESLSVQEPKPMRVNGPFQVRRLISRLLKK